ncbi:hypothetical protein L596_018320 [Steinernema carpocapsae]|uniref:Potassium channel domain-containing protein n=1 Tax=Steinernema carpocapsae TaxID=34508 RepID=A0A4U5N521_STECR|nr:hypothetical protein L596_018320 [Steinernema carpocapsae]
MRSTYLMASRLRDNSRILQDLVPEMASWKKYARIILPHVGLIILSMIYVFGGALIFYQLERPNEIEVRRSSLVDINRQTNLMLDSLWNVMNDNRTTEAQFMEMATTHIDNVTRILFEAFDTHYISSVHLRDPNSEMFHTWTMSTALFFTATLLTTIGYGNLVPVTFKGRMFCIFYALIGVPLILITVADIGKFLSENIIRLYSFYAITRKKCRQKAEAEQNAKNVPVPEDEVQRTGDQLVQLGLESYITLPIYLIGLIVLSYVTLLASILVYIEGWQFWEGFYYSFITMTTVGTSFFIISKMILGWLRRHCSDQAGVLHLLPVLHYYRLGYHVICLSRSHLPNFLISELWPSTSLASNTSARSTISAERSKTLATRLSTWAVRWFTSRILCDTPLSCIRNTARRRRRTTAFQKAPTLRRTWRSSATSITRRSQVSKAFRATFPTCSSAGQENRVLFEDFCCFFVLFIVEMNVIKAACRFEIVAIVSRRSTLENGIWFDLREQATNR